MRPIFWLRWAIKSSGKVVGFTGDFDQYGGVPAMQFLTPEMPWKWTKVKCSLDYLTCGTFYANPDNYEAEWTPTATTEFPISSTLLPLMFLLTGEMVKKAAGGAYTPWELRMEGGKHQ